MNPTGNDILIWITCLSVLGNLVLLGKQLFFGERTPQPLIIRKDTEFVSVSAFKTSHDAIDEQFVVVEKRMLETERRVEKAIDRMETTGETRASKLHHRLDKIAEEMPQRIITLLQTTGALKK